MSWRIISGRSHVDATQFLLSVCFRSQILLYFAIVNKSGKNVRARADVTRDNQFRACRFVYVVCILSDLT